MYKLTNCSVVRGVLWPLTQVSVDATFVWYPIPGQGDQDLKHDLARTDNGVSPFTRCILGPTDNMWYRSQWQTISVYMNLVQLCIFEPGLSGVVHPKGLSS